jgi:hypothetical protein
MYSLGHRMFEVLLISLEIKLHMLLFQETYLRWKVIVTLGTSADNVDCRKTM